VVIPDRRFGREDRSNIPERDPLTVRQRRGCVCLLACLAVVDWTCNSSLFRPCTRSQAPTTSPDTERRWPLYERGGGAILPTCASLSSLSLSLSASRNQSPGANLTYHHNQPEYPTPRLSTTSDTQSIYTAAGLSHPYPLGRPFGATSR
ncbi:unnamed protein product, partial [Ectocarpus fasciculatus]